MRVLDFASNVGAVRNEKIARPVSNALEPPFVADVRTNVFNEFHVLRCICTRTKGFEFTVHLRHFWQVAKAAEGPFIERHVLFIEQIGHRHGGIDEFIERAACGNDIVPFEDTGIVVLTALGHRCCTDSDFFQPYVFRIILEEGLTNFCKTP